MESSAAKEIIKSIAGQVRDGTQKGAAGIGFMSTQKRESRYSPAARTCRHEGDCRCRRNPSNDTERARARGIESLARWSRNASAGPGSETAPHQSIVWSIWFWMATKLLLKDQPIGMLVRPSSEVELPGSPPFRLAAFGLPASPGHPAIPFPSSHACLHPSWPQAPARIRRAERYDGQGNLYLLYAA